MKVHIKGVRNGVTDSRTFKTVKSLALFSGYSENTIRKYIKENKTLKIANTFYTVKECGKTKLEPNTKFYNILEIGTLSVIARYTLKQILELFNISASLFYQRYYDNYKFKYNGNEVFITKGGKMKTYILWKPEAIATEKLEVKNLSKFAKKLKVTLEEIEFALNNGTLLKNEWLIDEKMEEGK